MSTRTRLELCQAIVSELGILGGNGLTTTIGQTGEKLNIVTWIDDADMYVQNLWLDWDFLWTEQTGQEVAINTSYLPAPASGSVRSIKNDSLILFPDSSDAHQPRWLNYPEFKRAYRLREIPTSTKPAYWSRKPDGTIVLNDKVVAATDFQLDYWKWPVRMSANNSTSPIPGNFDRIIICKAKITYAEREDAPEVLAGASAEYADLLEKLESLHLPLQQSRTAQADHPSVELC